MKIVKLSSLLAPMSIPVLAGIIASYVPAYTSIYAKTIVAYYLVVMLFGIFGSYYQSLLYSKPLDGLNARQIMVDSLPFLPLMAVSLILFGFAHEDILLFLSIGLIYWVKAFLSIFRKLTANFFSLATTDTALLLLIFVLAYMQWFNIVFFVLLIAVFVRFRREVYSRSSSINSNYVLYIVSTAPAAFLSQGDVFFFVSESPEFLVELSFLKYISFSILFVSQYLWLSNRVFIKRNLDKFTIRTSFVLSVKKIILPSAFVGFLSYAVLYFAFYKFGLIGEYILLSDLVAIYIMNFFLLILSSVTEIGLIFGLIRLPVLMAILQSVFSIYLLFFTKVESLSYLYLASGAWYLVVLVMIGVYVLRYSKVSKGI